MPLQAVDHALRAIPQQQMVVGVQVPGNRDSLGTLVTVLASGAEFVEGRPEPGSDFLGLSVRQGGKPIGGANGLIHLIGIAESHEGYGDARIIENET